MALQELAALSLDSLGKIEIYALHLDGDQVLAGFCDIAKPMEPCGVLWCETGASQRVESQFLPPLDFTPGLDGEVVPFSTTGDSIAVFAAGVLRSGAVRAAVCLLDRRSKHWHIPGRLDESTPVVLGYARGSSHLVHLAGGGSRIQFIDVASGATREVPLGRNHRPRRIAVNASLSHFAFAGAEEGILCAKIDGTLECSWPTAGPVRWLWFAEDDLAIIARMRDRLVLHQWGGGVQEFSIPGLFPESFDPATRTALFCNQHTRGYAELDLSNGGLRSSGLLPEFHRIEVDLRRRRIVTYKPGLLQVFQMS